jgi:nucleotide-binding universal stress UspA family protein
MRVIFVPVADRPECAVTLDTAFALGHQLSASVIGCHIRPHRDSPTELPSIAGLSGFVNEDAEWLVTPKPKNTKKAGTQAKALFSRFAERHGYDLIRHPRSKPGAVWVEKTGSPNKVMGIMGPMADLLVLSRPAKKGGVLARQFLSASLLKSSRPVLVLPPSQNRPVGKNICIAWNQSVEATQAVAAAMSLLAQADRVFIVTCGKETRAGPKSGQLATYLKYWGIKSEHVSTRGKDETAEIVEAYKSTGSDLLLMGAYSRNRMSQLVFGGVTEYMLKRASLPVLMLHS